MMRTKKHWILNYMRYHDGARYKDVVKACGLTCADVTNRDTCKMVAEGQLSRDDIGHLHITDDGLALHDSQRARLYEGVEE